MPLKVSVEKRDHSFLIRPEGSIDANTYEILKTEVEAILSKSPSTIIFDMKDVHFVSSAGIGVVLMAEKEMEKKGGDILMVNVQPQIQKVFEIVQAIPSQRIFKSVDEMDRYLATIQRKVKDGEL